MDGTQHMDVRRVSRGVYPPSFCNWRMVLDIAVVTQISVLLIGLGRYQGISWQWLSVTSAYGQSLALACAMVVCISRAWLKRMSMRDAWLTSWVLALLTALAFSYSCGVIGSVLGFGPGKALLPAFMLKSTLAVGLVFMALLRYLFVRAQWQRELIAQADARVQALQARIRPHFLFNSLNTIASLIPGEPENAERATMDLADLFRGSMRRADKMIPLSEELQLARKYLDMEQRRIGQRLRVEWSVEELPGAALVLPLILQPLLENALTHGIQPREEGGLVKVYGRAENENIVITITNPMNDVDNVSTVHASGHGMALKNIRKRLELAFDGRASLISSNNEEQFFSVLSFPNDSHSDH